jgi:restriction system protein
VVTRDELPNYLELMYPTLKAVDELGGSAQGREITAQVLEDIGATPEQLELTYDKRPKSVLIDRIDWARSYVTLGGVLERPRRGLYVLSSLGREILAKPEAQGKEQLRSIDRDVRARRRATPTPVPADGEGDLTEEGSLLDDEEPELSPWREALLTRLHRLSPKPRCTDGFVVGADLSNCARGLV